ncbi:MAG: serine/threonine protein kinase [Lentisphaeria bacterium]|nr:serine/threonine protein kinase [Lentisphaeria bacterium]
MTEGLNNSPVLCGQYRILSRISENITGTIYQCLDETTGDTVALKQLPAILTNHEDEMQLITETVQPLYKLNHQNIASFRQLIKDTENNVCFLITDYVAGCDLTAWMRKKRIDGVLPHHEIVPVIKQIADALDYAHSQQVIHKALKPENIMIEPDGTVRLLNFSISAQIRECIARLQPDLGETRSNGPYIAPEQWRDKKACANTDQYALGILVYELLAGELPYKCTRQTSLAIMKELTVTEEPEPIESVTPQVWNIIDRAVKKEPAERFPLCKSFAFALEQAIPVPTTELPGETQTAIPQNKKSGGIIWAALTGIIGAAAGYFIYKTIGGGIGFAAGFIIGLLFRRK